MSQCRACNADVIWRRTYPNGKPIPLDPPPWYIAPDETGPDVGVTDRGDTIRGHRQAEAGPGRQRVRTAHFATCPNWRGPR